MNLENMYLKMANSDRLLWQNVFLIWFVLKFFLLALDKAVPTYFSYAGKVFWALDSSSYVLEKENQF